jgi:TATA-binding protein-associated factor Taf7
VLPDADEEEEDNDERDDDEDEDDEDDDEEEEDEEDSVDELRTRLNIVNTICVCASELQRGLHHAAQTQNTIISSQPVRCGRF